MSQPDALVEFVVLPEHPGARLARRGDRTCHASMVSVALRNLLFSVVVARHGSQNLLEVMQSSD